MELSRTLSPGNVHRAGYGRRAAALGADLAFPGALGLALLGLLPPPASWAAAWLAAVISSALCEGGRCQATPGKRLLGLHVAQRLGGPLAPGGAWLRALVKYGPLLPGLLFSPWFLFLYVGYTACALARGGRAPQDLAARSVVTDDELYYRVAPAPATRRAGQGEGTGLICTAGTYAGAFFPLDGRRLVLGRDARRCNIVFPREERGVSAVHCEVLWDEKSRTVLLRDAGSTYGTRLGGGRRLGPDQMAVLRGKDGFAIGQDNCFVVQIADN